MQSAELFPGQAARRSEPAGGRRGRRRRHRLGHEDAGDQRGLCRRGLIGNLTPIDEKFKSESDHRGAAAQRARASRSVVAPALRAARSAHEADYPMSYRFDETDSVLVCDRVKIPWERVFLHNDGGDVAAHLHRDAGELLPEPPVEHPVLGQDGPDRRAREPHLPGQRHRQDSGGARDARPARLARSDRSAAWCTDRSTPARHGPTAIATPNRRIMYATLNWCQEHHTEIVDTLRTLLGG